MMNRITRLKKPLVRQVTVRSADSDPAAVGVDIVISPSSPMAR